MRIPIALCGIALALALASPAEAGKPISGIGIVVKKNPGTGNRFGAPGLPAIPADFFGPGSEPFAGQVGLQGQCSQNCNGCDNDCGGDVSDSRIDYVEDTDTGTFATAMARAALYSTAPIQVAVNGVASFFDVFVEIRAPGPVPDAPIPGSLLLPPGVTLAPGTSAVVATSSCDVHARFTFTNAATGAVVGQAIEADLHLVLQESNLPIARLADGTPAGHIVLGLDGSTTVPFTYASAGNALFLQVKSLAEAPVGVEGASWGTVKSLFR
jgi:hypothetical protein